MPTEKLGLPLTTLNIAADVPKVVNELANAIDEKAGSSSGLAQLDESKKVPTTQLPDASTSQKGATKLNDTTNSTSTTEAATANAVRKAKTEAKEYTDTAPEAMLQNMGRFSTKRSSKNANGTFLKVERKRKDGTLFMKAEFSNPNADGNPTVRTVTTYAADGTTVVGTPVIYDILYDADGDYVEEVPR